MLKSNHKLFFLILILSFISACSGKQKSGASTFPEISPAPDITIKPLFEGKLADSMEIFTAAKIQLDSAGRVYVFDEAKMDIKVFSAKGTPIQTIGHRGRGPGEFISYDGFFVFGDSAYEYDEKQRRMSVFSLDGALASTYGMNVGSPFTLLPLGTNHYLGIHSDLYSGSRKGNFARVYNHSFKTVGKPFLNIPALNPDLEEVIRIMAFRPGSVELTGTNTFIYVPLFYSGKLYKFGKDSSGKWALLDTYKGNTSHRSFTALENTTGRYPDFTLSSIHYKEPLKYIAYNQSRGLLTYNGKMYHFTQCEFDDGKNERVFGVEIYTEDMAPVGYLPIKSIPIRNVRGNSIGWYAEAVDKEGHFYIRERNLEGTRILRLNIDWDKTEI